jgi:hypothetical protein
MNVGGIYFLDGREAHSGGNLSASETRVHLVLDFDPDIPVVDLFQSPVKSMVNEPMPWISRPALPAVNLDHMLLGLSEVNYAFDASQVYDVLVESARLSGKSDLKSQAEKDREFFFGIAA